jgi:ribosomal protein S18 acetylase RimI-like enzyme
MSSEHAITIQLGLPAEHRQRAAALYYTAFRQKLQPIFGDEMCGVAVLYQALNPAYAVVARRQGELVGIAGFKDADGNLVDIQPHHMTQVFGWLGGWGRLLLLSLFSRTLRPHELLMDGIVVDETQRGLGIGSLLLDGIVNLARERGYEFIRLDVVDSNPRARQLYERKGFIAVRSESYPYLRWLFGFSGSTIMRKSVA